MISKEDIIELVINEPEKFNEIKIGEKIDLSEVDFSGQELKEVDFSGVDLTGAAFIEANLENINFSDADLASVDFTRAHVLNCNFTQANLTGCDFSYSTLSFCNFTDAEMTAGVFVESDLSNSDLSLSLNLHACRFDEDTIWPDYDLLPEDFDTTYSEDLSSLKDEEDRLEEHETY